MPVNKNALIRYKTIDNCLRNHYRRWTLDDLVLACSNALYEMEGISKGVSIRTIQGDIQMMRSDKLGYNAPIEVFEHKYYRYADLDYSITNMPISQSDYQMLQKAIDFLKELEDFEHFSEMSDVIGRLRDKLSISSKGGTPIIHFDSVSNLKGIRLLNPLYNYISRKQTIKVLYQSFSASKPQEYVLSPYLLKEFRNRWFLFGSKVGKSYIINLALDRIVGVESVDVPFFENPNFDSKHYFDNVIGVSKGVNSKPVLIKFWANAEQSNYIKTKPLHSSQRILKELVEDGSCLFSMEVVVNFEFYSVIMSYGPGIRIISPRNVVSYIVDKQREALSLYGEEKLDFFKSL